MLIQVTLPHLCAGVIARDDRIGRAAPILAWSIGRRPADLAVWVMDKGGRIEVVLR